MEGWEKERGDGSKREKGEDKVKPYWRRWGEGWGGEEREGGDNKGGESEKMGQRRHSWCFA